MANIQREYEQPDPHDNPENRDKKTQEKGSRSINKEKLTANEVRRLERREISIDDLVEERLQLKAAAEDELRRLVVAKQDNESIIELSEMKAYKVRLEEEQSPEKTKELLDEIKELPKKKAEEKARQKEEEKALDPNHPKLIELQKQFDDICDKNVKYIGTGEIEGFKAWFKEQRQKNPTVKHLKDQIRRLEGKEIFDNNGLAPRREEYGKLEKIFKQYGLQNPLESNWIKTQGKKERTEFRKNAEQLAEHFERRKGTGFYSKEMINKTMKTALTAENPTEQVNILNWSKNIARQEAEGFTHLDATMPVAGKNIRKMSESSKKKYLDYYKNTDLKEREELVNKWETLVNNEAKLTNQLEEIYGDDTENLKLALESFGEMDFMEKQDELKNHQNLVKDIADKKEREKTLVVKAATAKIQTAGKDNSISKSTEENYISFFEDANNFKDIHTGKPGDIDEMKKAYSVLVNPTPNDSHKNLAAYKARRKGFQKDLDLLIEENDELTESEIKDWNKKYDEEGWKKRERIHGELKTEILKAKKHNKENAKQKEIEEKAEVDEDATREIMDENLGLDEVRARVFEFFADKQPGEAMNVLVAYNNTNPDNPEILILMQTALDYIKQFGSGKKAADTLDDQIQEELDHILATDDSIEHQMLEAQIETKMIEGARQSEHLYNQTVDSQERARQESIDQFKGDDIATDLVESAYKQMGTDFILDEEGMGEEIKTIEFSKTEYKEDELQTLKRVTKQEQGRLDHRQGLSEFQLVDKDQNDISAKQAETKEKNGDRLELEEELAQKIEDKVTTKSGGEGAKVFDLHEQAAAARAAKAAIDKRRFSRIAA